VRAAAIHVGDTFSARLFPARATNGRHRDPRRSD
jgi:hypothetical protein